jgi:cell division septation protein DedD
MLFLFRGIFLAHCANQHLITNHKGSARQASARARRQELVDYEASKESSNHAKTRTSQSKPVAPGKQQDCPETYLGDGGVGGI